MTSAGILFHFVRFNVRLLDKILIQVDIKAIEEVFSRSATRTSGSQNSVNSVPEVRIGNKLKKKLFSNVYQFLRILEITSK